MSYYEDIGLWRTLSGQKILAEDKSKAPTKEDVIDFLKKNPNPDDSRFHEWASENDLDVDKAEEIAYGLATEYVKMLEK